MSCLPVVIPQVLTTSNVGYNFIGTLDEKYLVQFIIKILVLVDLESGRYAQNLSFQSIQRLYNASFGSLVVFFKLIL